jgi:pimeloyl-ACP methyl ester carboxylesterase
VSWLSTDLGLLLSAAACLLVVTAALAHIYLHLRFVPFLVRGFQEQPLFISPRGQPIPGAEDVVLNTVGGLKLRGCYLRHTAPQRRGVIFFGLEFGSNRWACLPYCEHLLEAGYDVFAFEPRCQGESDPQPGYEPLQWATDFEVEDTRAALAYLKKRSDADPRGVGLFGISKGGVAGVLAAADDPWVRCFVTDGIFGTYSTTVQYMRKWIAIYSNKLRLQKLAPLWYYRHFARAGLRIVARTRRCRFPYLEEAMARLAPRPLLMIHGGGDTYIRPEMAEALFARAGQPKQLWLVDGAKHNQALQLAGDEYKHRVLEFFNEHLADPAAAPLQPATAPPLPAPAELAKTP